MPTILDAVGIDPAHTGGGWPNFEERGTRLHLTGKSLIPILTDRDSICRDFAVSAYHGRQWAIRTDDWTYLWNIDGARPAELYDRKQDPQETQNVIEAQRGVADAMEHRLERFAKEIKPANYG
jgi:arylsulfatase A-like enzyme